jgi:hypothetical protein
MKQVLTANRLGDGRVVFLDRDGGWTTDIDAAQLATSEEAAARLAAAGERAERDCVVVGPYLIAVRDDGGRIRAAAIREAIRATGPTVQAGQF